MNTTADHQSTPNPAAWIIWLVIDSMNCVNYFLIVGNVWQSLVSFVATGAIIATFIYSIKNGKFSPLGWVEITAIVLAAITAIFWKTTGDIRLTNIFLQLILAISFWPIIQGIISGKVHEKPLPWLLGVLAYVWGVDAIIVKENYDWVALAYPIVSGVLGNGTVALLAFINNPSSKSI